jgi:asparagine synthase (glutamine-hydrolysing)
LSGFIAILNGDGAPVDAALLRASIDLPPFESPCEVWTGGPFGVACSPLDQGARDAASKRSRRDALLSDASCVIAFDGRLDDRASLVQRLANGLHADETTDVELVAAAYARWGTSSPRYLFGDFAFCVWDVRRRTLFAARDHFGVKPLFFSRIGHALVVSNALRAIRRHPRIPDRLDDQTVGDLLLFGLGMDPSRTSFAGVSRLPPAHVLTCRADDVTPRIERYWALEIEEASPDRNIDEAADEFGSVFRGAVRDRLRGGPIGIFMSGGLDSSSIAVTAAGELGTSAHTALHAFTGVYDEVADDEERYYSSIVAAVLDIRIDHIPLDGYAFFDRWDRDRLPPEPTTEPLITTTVDMLERVAGHGAAILTGDGGDPLMRPSTLASQLGRVPIGRLLAGLWRCRHAGSFPPIGIRSSMLRWMRGTPSESPVPMWLATSLQRTYDARARWIDVMKQRHANRGARSAAINAVVDPWWTSLFEGYDPGATGKPVAFRYPFFDVRLVNIALRLPSFPFCVNKHVLRTAMRGRLPDLVRLRAKAPLAFAPQSVHGKWSVDDAVRALDSAPVIDEYVDRRAFASSVRPADLFTDRAPGSLAAVCLATWLRCSTSAVTTA